MYLLYVDESFDDAEFWMSGLLLPISSALELEQSLDALVTTSAPRFGVSATAELHGYDLAQGKRDWASMAPMLRARLGIFADALRAIAATPGARAFQYGLDRHRHQQRYTTPWPEREILLGHLAQRVNGVVGDACALVIVDDTPAQESIRARFRHLKTVGTASRINSEPLRHILDTVYFAPSQHSRLLQASDLVSYIHFRHRSVTLRRAADPRSTRATEELWDLVAPRCGGSFWTP